MWPVEVEDPRLFDKNTLLSNATETPSVITDYKAALSQGDQYLTERFEGGAPVKELVYKRAWLVDQLLICAWQQHINSDAMALVAVGGYGRGDLLPASDIDLMLLIEARKQLKSKIERFLAFLWDIGLEVGHSVRTVKDCVTEAKDRHYYCNKHHGVKTD